MTSAPVHQRSLASRIWSQALDAVFPPRCVSCRTLGRFVCADCTAQMVRARHPRCGVCWQPSADSRCEHCRQVPPGFTAVRSVYAYGGAARDLIHALKYTSLSAAAPLMGGEMAGLLLDWTPSVSAIVPVPMAGTRQRRRGYNQSELLAREIGRRAEMPVLGQALVRRPGPSQVEQPDEAARRANVKGAFAAGRQAVGGSVLLVDDAMTTGATLDACARALRSAGADRVYGLTFARES
ncbi:MAG TPA: ComF family protein [Dehalococcoidia bacterium]